MRVFRCLSAFAAAALTALPGFAAHAQATCFSAGDNRNLPFEVYWQAPPPTDLKDPNYPFFPLTAATSMNLERINASHAPGIDDYYFLWSNRCHALEGSAGNCGWSKKGNVVFPPLSGSSGEVRSFFSGFDQADNCTLAQAAVALGKSKAQVERYLQKGGLPGLTDRAEALARQRDGRLVDLCPLPAAAMSPDAAGIVLDYEVADKRTPQHTLEFLTEFVTLVHSAGKKAILFADPLDAPTQKYTGIQASNGNQLHRLFDRTVIFLWSKNRQGNLMASADSQMQVLKSGGPVDPSRLLISFELSNSTLQDASAVRQLILSHHLAGVMFWRNFAAVGGDCGSPTNSRIACLLFGRCG